MRSDRDCQWRHWVYFVYWPACWVLEDDTVMRYRRIYEYSRGHPWATSSIFPRFLQTVPQLRFFISKQGHLTSHLLGIFLDRSSWSSLRMEACHSLIYNFHSNVLGSIETHLNVLEHIETHWNVLEHIGIHWNSSKSYKFKARQSAANYAVQLKCPLPTGRRLMVWSYCDHRTSPTYVQTRTVSRSWKRLISGQRAVQYGRASSKPRQPHN